MTEIEWPFLGQEVLAAKALPERAMRSLYDPIYPGVYVPSGIVLTASQRAEAAWLCPDGGELQRVCRPLPYWALSGWTQRSTQS